METKLWILGGLVVVMGGILAFVGQFVAKLILQRLDGIIEQLQRLNTATALHGQDIKNLQDANADLEKRLNGHADRIRHIEMNIRPHGHIET